MVAAASSAARPCRREPTYLGMPLDLAVDARPRSDRDRRIIVRMELQPDGRPPVPTAVYYTLNYRSPGNRKLYEVPEGSWGPVYRAWRDNPIG